MKRVVGGKELIVEKDNDIYDIYILFHTKYSYVRPLYKGTDIEKAREIVNNYYDKHVEDIKQLRKRDLNLLEKLI